MIVRSSPTAFLGGGGGGAACLKGKHVAIDLGVDFTQQDRLVVKLKILKTFL